MDKMDLARQIGQLEGNISNAEAEIRRTEGKLSSARFNLVAGGVAMAVAVLGFFILAFFWWLWGLVGLAGAITATIALVNQYDAGKERAKQQAWMSQARATLAEWRALIMAA